MALVGKKFEKAQRVACKAAIMLEGLSGKGKSGLALMIATSLATNPDKVYAIDTENKSLQLFVDLKKSNGGVFHNFKICDLSAADGYKPTNYLELRALAIKQGAEVVIKDSISHAWQYEGGILTMVSNIAARSNKAADKYAPWRDPDVIKEKNALLELLRCSDCHVITTVRVKEKFVPEKDETGKTVIKSLGEQQIMQDDIKFEPDLVLHMLKAGKVKPDGTVVHPIVTVVKSRYAIFTEDEEYELTPDLLEQLRKYLAEGVDPDVLLAQQKKDYTTAVAAYLTNNTHKQPIWKVIKAEAGYSTVPLDDMPLNIIKELFSKLTL